MARDGRGARVTALATRIPSAPNSRARRTSRRSRIPAPHSTWVPGETRRTASTVPEMTWGFAVETETSPR